MARIDVPGMQREEERVNALATEVITADTGKLHDLIASRLEDIDEFFKDRKVAKAIVARGVNVESVEAILNRAEAEDVLRANVYSAFARLYEGASRESSRHGEAFTSNYFTYTIRALKERSVKHTL